MKLTKTKLPSTSNEVIIVPMADLHIGSNEFNRELVDKQIEFVRKTPNAYAVLVGDLINNSTKNSVGDVYGEKLTPMEQCKLAVELLSPIKDKILAMVNGNHERRSAKDCGVDLGYFIAAEMGIADKYDPIGVLTFLRFGKVLDKSKGNQTLVTIYITHGDKIGGTTMGGKMNGLEKRGNIVDADVVVVGHTHSPATFKSSTFVIDEKNSTVTEKETTFVNCGATIGYESYAEMVGLRPSSTAQPVIHLTAKRWTGDKKSIKVCI